VSFEACSKDLFFRSTKMQDPRLGELVNINADSQLPRYVIAGYPDDEGIQINGGRVGAKLAPDTIRKYFYKTTPVSGTPTFALSDIGNLKTASSLEQRHQSVKNEILKNLKPNTTWIGLGGGHDYGYPDGAGFLMSCQNEKNKPLVINFDAHLDVRPTDQGLSSGTPFYRLLTDSTLPSFDFVEVGIQRQCNSPHHIEWLLQKTPHVHFFDELFFESNWWQALYSRLAPLLIQKRPTYISIDIDGFSSAWAPGCSQSWATGFDPNGFVALLSLLKKRLDVRCLGIYEVSPPLDIDDRTSKLAALLLHSFIHA
jgi:formiminoglutamase